MTPQQGIVLSFAVGAAAVAAAFLWVVLRSRRAAAADGSEPPVERLRAVWFGLLALGTLATLALTVPRAPYPAFQLAQEPAGDRPAVVHVTARQFSWDLSDRQLPPGRPIRFEVTSADVNHGFGVYDRQNRLVAQVQAMPGYTNTLIVRFDQPGSYLVRCLELCGCCHASMISTFCVGSCGGG